MVGKTSFVIELASRAKLFSVGLIAFSVLMLLMPLLPTGYSSNVPNQACPTTTIVAGTTSEFVTTITSTGTQTTTETITVSSTTSTLSVVTCDTSPTTGTETVVVEVDVLLGLVIIVAAVGGRVLSVDLVPVLMPWLILTSTLTAAVVGAFLMRRRMHQN
jgi:hypothetical protein